MIVVDASIPKPVVSALRAARIEEDDPIFWLPELLPPPNYGLPQDTHDVDWIARCGLEGWILITHDKHLRSRPDERRLMIDNRVACYCVRSSRSPTILEYVQLLAAVLPEVEAIALSEDRPYFYGIYLPGRLQRWSVRHPDTGVIY